MSLYSLIRWLFVVGSIVAIFIIANKSQKRAVSIICGFAILISAIALDFRFPIENNFISFKTIQNAFSYINNGKIIDVIEGAKSGLVVYEDDDAIGLCFLPKTEKNRWEIDSIFSFDTVYDKIINIKDIDYNVTVYQTKKTNDFYIVIDAWFVTEKPIVSDNKESDFVCVERTYANTNKMAYSFLTYIENLNKEYKIQVNNETIAVSLSNTEYSAA